MPATTRTSHAAADLVRLGLNVISDPVSGPTGPDVVRRVARLRGELGRQKFDQAVAHLVLITAAFAQDHPDRDAHLDALSDHPLLNGGQ